MRELTADEVAGVSGGVANIAIGAIGAAVNASFSGAGYALATLGDGTFTWGGFALTVGTGAAGGFLIGSGVGLIAAAATGAAKGATIAGVTSLGVGGIIQVIPDLVELEEKSGGS